MLEIYRVIDIIMQGYVELYGDMKGRRVEHREDGPLGLQSFSGFKLMSLPS